MATVERWVLLESHTLVTTRWLDVLRNRYRTTGREIADYFVVRRSDFVLVLAVDDDDNMLLVRQYRPATDGFYIALPAGYIEPGETAIEAGRRELFEETGITGSGWRHVGKLDPLPGYVKSRAHVVRCNVSVLPAARTRQDTAEDEVVETLVFARDVVRLMITRGEIIEMQAVAAFLLADAVERAGAFAAAPPSYSGPD